ncbi:hypothetical protein [Moritella viscosa]|uniref:Uncharacterized protein n=1 Tax=Moritella viscosa TaxID=80854 RepID=A0A1K9ZET2_9GAMM|nr:hypothetical protein [Moritella viscosa]SGY96054.1 Putative uncharacterized protein [Moritella viscosa]
MGQAQLAIVETAPPSADSIAQIHSLFGSSRIGCIYDKLDENLKKGILVAAGLKMPHLKLKLSELDPLDKVKLHHAINALEPVIGKLAGHSISEFK